MTDVQAFPAIDEFYQDHQSAFAAVGMTRQLFNAGKATCDKLRRLVARTGEDLRRGALYPPQTADVRELAHTRLFLVRDSIRRKTEMPRDRAVRADFGFDVRFTVHATDSMREAIQSFLRGAQKNKEVLEKAFITDEMVDELRASLADLERLLATKGTTRLDKRDVAVQIGDAHEELEAFYDDFACAVNAAFRRDASTRVVGLGLVPRAPRRSAGEEPVVPVTPAVAAVASVARPDDSNGSTTG